MSSGNQYKLDKLIPVTENQKHPLSLKGQIAMEERSLDREEVEKMLRNTPVRHDGIPEGLQRPVRWQYKHLGHRVQPTYEQWELNFMKETNQVFEIYQWTRMTWVYLEFLRRHPHYSEDVIATATMMLSVGNEPQGLTKKAIKELPRRKGPAYFGFPQ